MTYLTHFDFVWDIFISFFEMPLTLIFIASLAFLALELLTNKVMRGGM